MHLKWDHYSDQPEVIKNKTLKKQIRRQTRWASLKLLVINIFVYPFSYFLYRLLSPKRQLVNANDFFGIGVNLDKNPDKTVELIEQLGVNKLLIRVPLSEIENLSAFFEFAKQFKRKDLIINILQDRCHVEDLELLHESLDKIFQQFSGLCAHFQIGNAINRKKWAFFSMDEYLAFYKVAYALKKNKYPEITLLGSSIIDFEYYFTIRTLFNFHKVYFDQCSSLLYVDRRGAPENTQMGLDLINKLNFLQMLLRLSPKSGTDIVISETNWPIKNTAPYAPTGEKECVSLDDHANYLVRYYLLALASGTVKSVYWHQLIAPGYGLIDNRDDEIIKYPAFYALKTLVSILKNTEFLDLEVSGKQYYASFQNLETHKKTEIYWGLEAFTVETNGRKAIQRDGAEIPSKQLQIGESPVYLITE